MSKVEERLERLVFLKFRNPSVSSKYLKFIEQREADGRPICLAQLWKGHWKFQVPDSILQYKGQVPAHTTLLLFNHAQGRYRRSASVRALVLEATVQGKADAGSLSARSIERSFKRLEKDRLIRRDKRRRNRKYPGMYSAPQITFLIPGTDEPLQTIPSNNGLLTANDVEGYIVVPQESLQAINKMMEAAAKAVYIAALDLATRALAETIYVTKAEWMLRSGLERCAFNRGLKYCKRHSLLTYVANVLTVNDAHTGKPTEQWNETGTWDGEPNPDWEVNFDEITNAGQWDAIFQLEFGTEIPLSCLSCGNVKRFGVNFSKNGFNCFNCGSKGSLAEFIKQHHGFDWPQTRKHLAAQRKKLEVDVQI